MSLAKTLRELRKGSGLSQSALAEDLEVVQSTVSEWESGKTHPRYGHLQSLASYFKTSIAKLLEAA